MFDLLNALVGLRLAVTGLLVGAALVVLGLWSLANGAVGVGVAVLAAVALGAALVATVARSRMREH